MSGSSAHVPLHVRGRSVFGVLNFHIYAVAIRVGGHWADDASAVWSGLIRRSQVRILLLHERRELVEVL